jgi:hypothetical protein
MENNRTGNSISHLHNQLTERAFNNWEEFRHSPQISSPDNIFTDAVKIICRRDAYHFIKHYKEFTVEQLNYLLQFENPTELVGDYLDPSNDISVMPGVLDDILKNQGEYKGIYKTISDLSTLSPEEKEQELQAKLAEGFALYKQDMLSLSNEELFSAASEIASVSESFDYFSTEHGFTEQEVDFLLKYKKPLELISDKWDIGLRNLTDTLSAIFDNREQILQSGGYELTANMRKNTTAPSSTDILNPLEKRSGGPSADTGDRLSVRIALYRARQESQDCNSLQKKPIARSNFEHEH